MFQTLRNLLEKTENTFSTDFSDLNLPPGRLKSIWGTPKSKKKLCWVKYRGFARCEETQQTLPKHTAKQGRA